MHPQHIFFLFYTSLLLLHYLAYLPSECFFLCAFLYIVSLLLCRCKSGELMGTGECERGAIWDYATASCGVGPRASCSPPSCWGLSDGAHPMQGTECAAYFTCNSSKRTDHVCPSGTTFDYTEKVSMASWCPIKNKTGCPFKDRSGCLTFQRYIRMSLRGLIKVCDPTLSRDHTYIALIFTFSL